MKKGKDKGNGLDLSKNKCEMEVQIFCGNYERCRKIGWSCQLVETIADSLAKYIGLSSDGYMDCQLHCSDYDEREPMHVSWKIMDEHPLRK